VWVDLYELQQYAVHGLRIKARHAHLHHWEHSPAKTLISFILQ
jgi:hypothetical protein